MYNLYASQTLESILVGSSVELSLFQTAQLVSSIARQLSLLREGPSEPGQL